MTLAHFSRELYSGSSSEPSRLKPTTMDLKTKIISSIVIEADPSKSKITKISLIFFEKGAWADKIKAEMNSNKFT